MAKNIRDFDGAVAKKAESTVLANSNNAASDNADIAANGNSDRDEIRADKMDRICEIGQELSDKVLKKIESKDYLQSNLKRKSEDVSRETLENNKENNEQGNVLFNGFTVFALLCAVVLYIFSRFLGKKSQKNSQNPPFENADISSGENTSGQKASENDSLADAILTRAGDK